MDLIEALKAVAPAVGDGKIVSLHAYVKKDGPWLSATNGKLWAYAHSDTGGSFVVRHEPLMKALSRDGATLHVGSSVRVQAGRSRVTLKSVDAEDFPTVSPGAVLWHWNPPADFLEVLKNLSKFCAGSDGHIWQQGVHFTSDMAFAANSHTAACYSHGWGLPWPLTLPPWAVDYLLTQDCPEIISDKSNVLQFNWEGFRMVSTKLIEEPPERAANMLLNVFTDDLSPVPDNLKEAVERAASYDVETLTLGEGRLSHRTEEMDLEDAVSVDTPPRQWKVKNILQALELATHISLADHPARWKGGQYVGMFAGLSPGR